MNYHTEDELIKWVHNTYIETYPQVERYAKMLISVYCGAMESDLEDLIHQVYLIMHNKRVKLIQHENIVGWLIVTTRLCFNNRMRKMQHRNEKLVEPGVMETYQDAVNDIDRILMDGSEEMLEIIRAAINDDDKYRAFIDFHLHHVPIRELAKRYGKSEGAMKVQLHRSRKLLQAIFENKMGVYWIIFLLRVTFFDFRT